MTDKLALVISAWVVVASAYVGYVNPARRWQCVLGMAVPGAMWLIRHSFRGTTQARIEARQKITQSMIFASLLLSVGLVSALGWVAASGEFHVRASQVLAGVFVAMIGNVIPKKAIASRRRATVLRANGKAFVLGGLGYALAWLFLPLAYAKEVALSIMLLTFAYTMYRIASCFVHGDPLIPPTDPA